MYTGLVSGERFEEGEMRHYKRQIVNTMDDVVRVGDIVEVIGVGYPARVVSIDAPDDPIPYFVEFRDGAEMYCTRAQIVKRTK